MKYIHLIIGLICLILNVAIYLVFDGMGNHVLTISSCVIVTTALINHFSGVINQKEGFKVALPFFFTFNGMVEYALSFFVNDTLKNDGCLVAILVLFVIQITMLIVTSLVSKHDS